MISRHSDPSDVSAPAAGQSGTLAEALAEVLPRIAAARRGRAVAYAAFDVASGALVRRWSVLADGTFEAGELALEPSRLHPLLTDDACGERPVRPGSTIADWAHRDILGMSADEAAGTYVRAVSWNGRLLGVLMVAEPRRLLGRASAMDLASAGMMVEMAAGRVHLNGELARVQEEHRDALDAARKRSAERIRALESELASARASAAAARPRHSALEDATAAATEMLADTHVELARRSDRLRRQTRLLHHIRKMLGRHAMGASPRELAQDLVRCTADAFGGTRCSLMLADGRQRDGRDELRLAAAMGLPAGVDPLGVCVASGQGVSGWVAENLSAIVVRDSNEAGRYPLMADSGYTGSAFVSLPLVFRGRFQGVLNLTNFRDGTFDDAELEQLRLVALCIALVVDHARLSQRLFPVEAAAR